MKTELLSELKNRANTYFNDELACITYPVKNSIKLTFESSKSAEQFVNENQNLKSSRGLVFQNVNFEQDNDSVYCELLK